MPHLLNKPTKQRMPAPHPTISSDSTNSCTLHNEESNATKDLMLDHSAISSKDDFRDVNDQFHEPMWTDSHPENPYDPHYLIL